MQKATSGGSRETGTKLLAASPVRSPSTSAAMATTPLGNWPYAWRRVGVSRVQDMSEEVDAVMRHLPFWELMQEPEWARECRAADRAAGHRRCHVHRRCPDRLAEPG